MRVHLTPLTFALILVCSFVVNGIVVTGWTAPEPPNSQQVIPWKDVDTRDFNERRKDWPGNYPLLAIISSIFEGCHAIRPEYRHCHYPVFINNKVYKSKREIDDMLDLEAKAGITNKSRKYNQHVRSLILLDDQHMRTHPTFKEIPPRLKQQIEDLSKKHNQKCLYVHMSVDFESLQSDRIDTSDVIMLFVNKDGRWGLVFIYGLEW